MIAVPGTGVSRTFNCTATAQIAANGTKAFNPVISTGSNTNPVGTVTITPAPGGAGTGTGDTATIV